MNEISEKNDFDESYEPTFNEKNDNTLSHINVGKGDGKPYVTKSWEKYNKMSKEEKEEVDKLRKKLYKKFGIDEE